MGIEPKTLPDTVPISDLDGVIAAIIARWADAWNAHDDGAMAALVAPDVDFVNVAGRWLRGVEEFQQWHRQIHRLHLRDSRWSNLRHRYKFLTAELALVHLEWAINGEWAHDGTPGPQRCGIFTWLVEHRDGAWLIATAHNTNLGPGVAHRLSIAARAGCPIEGATS
jgi:uncharacterized protein (TIGR02246 family)